MANNWEKLWQFETRRFKVVLDATWDDDMDVSWDETGETQEKLRTGEWGCFLFRVRVLFDGLEIGCDYLGNSVYADPNEFYREHFGIRAKGRDAGCNFGCYFTDIVHSAIREARRFRDTMPILRQA